MKMNGKPFSRPSEEVLVLPRAEGEDIVLKFQSVLDMDAYGKQFPEPTPPHKRLPGQKESTPDYTDPTYTKAMEKYGSQKSTWMFLKSFEANEGLEWDTIKMNDPETWSNMEVELKSAGFNPFEIGLVISAIMRVNSLDDAHIKEARARFFAQEALAAKK